MAVKISQRTREQAALICAIAASNWPQISDSYRAAQWAVGSARSRGAWLARRAIGHTNLQEPQARQAEVYANAEALIRTGWRPRC